jgi:hypothetical protein
MVKGFSIYNGVFGALFSTTGWTNSGHDLLLACSNSVSFLLDCSQGRIQTASNCCHKENEARLERG